MVPWKKKKIPTDIQILEYIYDEYFEEFPKYGDGSRNTKIYLPIDCYKIADNFSVDGDIIFGRLYYYLDKKYGYENGDGRGRVAFFSPVVGKDRNCIHFPLMTSVLASMQYERRTITLTYVFSVVALVLSGLSLAVEVIK